MPRKEIIVDKKSENLTFAVLAIVLGLLFIIFKSAIISLTMTVFGILLIVSGVLDLMKKAVTGGVIKVVAGVVIIVFGWTLLTAALYVLAALLLIFGIIELYNTIRRRKSLGKTEFTMYAVEYALFIAIGVCLLFNQVGAIDWIFIVSGIVLIVDGLLALAQLVRTEAPKKQEKPAGAKTVRATEVRKDGAAEKKSQGDKPAKKSSGGK